MTSLYGLASRWHRQARSMIFKNSNFTPNVPQMLNELNLIFTIVCYFFDFSFCHVFVFNLGYVEFPGFIFAVMLVAE